MGKVEGSEMISSIMTMKGKSRERTLGGGGGELVSSKQGEDNPLNPFSFFLSQVQRKEKAEGCKVGEGSGVASPLEPTRGMFLWDT